jgi:hypothetical protein
MTRTAQSTGLAKIVGGRIGHVGDDNKNSRKQKQLSLKKEADVFASASCVSSESKKKA